eukprot:6474086-Amphidinium_carterae.1
MYRSSSAVTVRRTRNSALSDVGALTQSKDSGDTGCQCIECAVYECRGDIGTPTHTHTHTHTTCTCKAGKALILHTGPIVSKQDWLQNKQGLLRIKGTRVHTVFCNFQLRSRLTLSKFLFACTKATAALGKGCYWEGRRLLIALSSAGWGIPSQASPDSVQSPSASNLHSPSGTIRVVSGGLPSSLNHLQVETALLNIPCNERRFPFLSIMFGC